MKIQTFSIVVGTRACDARCPFCVSKMTGFGVLPKTRRIDRINFDKACRLAELSGSTTVLMTGKGEPTLYPEEITAYLNLLKKWEFPLIELQTNGLMLGRLAQGETDGLPKGLNRKILAAWRRKGLNTVAISAVSVENWRNATIYSMDYPDLATTIKFLHSFGFTVRLCIMMLEGFVDTPRKVQAVIDFCRAHRVEQLTIRSIRKPQVSNYDKKATQFVTERGLTDFEVKNINTWCLRRGKKMMTLPHDAVVLDINGQNVCVTSCLNEDGESDDIRTLIYYSDGSLRYRWDYDGAIILGGTGSE